MDEAHPFVTRGVVVVRNVPRLSQGSDNSREGSSNVPMSPIVWLRVNPLGRQAVKPILSSPTIDELNPEASLPA